MKRIMLLVATLITGHNIFAMRLPTPSTPRDNLNLESLYSIYDDPKAKDEFASTINHIIISSLKDEESSNKLFDELNHYANKHPMDAEVYWKLNKGRTLAVAKAMRDHARALAIGSATTSTALEHHLSGSKVDTKLFRTSLNIGYLNDFNAIIENIVNLQKFKIQVSPSKK
jgi:hypothetical protein